MKIRLLFSFAFFLSTAFAFGQNDTKGNDIDINFTPFKGMNDTLTKVKTRWVIFEFGNSSYLHQGSFKLPSQGSVGTGASAFRLLPFRSVNVNIYLFQQRVSLVKHRLNFIHGIGFEIHSYSFKYPTQLAANESSLTFFQDSINYRKNKLNTSLLTLPLMLNYESKPGQFEKSFRASFGAYGGLLFGARTKTKSAAKGTVRKRDDYNLNKLRYGLRAELGFGPVNFYATYSLNTLFKEEEFPDLHPLSIGIKIIPF